MAIEKTIVINADTSDADKKIQDLLKDTNSSVKKTNDSLETMNNEVSEIGKSAKKSEKGVKSLAKGFRGMGLALKAAGIGLIIAGFQIFKDLLSQNQKTVDFFTTAMGSLSLVFNDFFKFILDSVSPVKSFFKDIFENPLDNIKSLGRAIKDNLIERFVSLLDVLGFVGSALKKFFQGDFKGALEDVKSAGSEMVDVFTGVDDSLNKATETLGKVTDAVLKYGEAIVDTAQKNVELAKSAEVAAVVNQGLIEKYDQQAEKLRQIRDDDAKSVADRIKANNELGEVLERQFIAMQNNADIILANARAQFKANDTQENYIQLLEAQNEKAAINAQIEGFRSEQIVNNVALKREEIELNNTASDAEKERRIAQLEFDAELEQNELARLEKQKENIALEEEIALEKLERDRLLFLEGTQARLDAEEEYLSRKQELANKEKGIDEETARKQIELSEAVANAKYDIANNTLGLLAQIAGEDSKIGKGLAVGQATISGIQGVQNAYSTAQKSPITAVFPAYPAIQAGLAGAFSAVQIKKILSTDASGASGGGGAQASSPTAPSFNLVRGTGSNQISNSIDQQQTKPIEAFVVTSKVTTGQELDRNAIEEGSI